MLAIPAVIPDEQIIQKIPGEERNSPVKFDPEIPPWFTPSAQNERIFAPPQAGALGGGLLISSQKHYPHALFAVAIGQRAIFTKIKKYLVELPSLQIRKNNLKNPHWPPKKCHKLGFCTSSRNQTSQNTNCYSWGKIMGKNRNFWW